MMNSIIDLSNSLLCILAAQRADKLPDVKVLAQKNGVAHMACMQFYQI